MTLFCDESSETPYRPVRTVDTVGNTLLVPSLVHCFIAIVCMSKLSANTGSPPKETQASGTTLFVHACVSIIRSCRVDEARLAVSCAAGFTCLDCDKKKWSAVGSRNGFADARYVDASTSIPKIQRQSDSSSCHLTFERRLSVATQQRCIKAHRV